MLNDLALVLKSHRDYINELSYSGYQEYKKKQRKLMAINESNIMWRDSTGVIRKWIDQKTGDLMEHDCERLSLCCGAGANEYIEEFCNGCNEYAEFECIECTKEFGITKEQAFALLNSIRGRYIVGQALHYGIQELEKVARPYREVSNIADMKLLREELFNVPVFNVKGNVVTEEESLIE